LKNPFTGNHGIKNERKPYGGEGADRTRGGKDKISDLFLRMPSHKKPSCLGDNKFELAIVGVKEAKRARTRGT